MSLSLKIENYVLKRGCVSGIDEDFSPLIGVNFHGNHYVVNRDDYVRSVKPRMAFRLVSYDYKGRIAKVIEITDSLLLGEIERLVLNKIKVSKK